MPNPFPLRQCHHCGRKAVVHDPDGAHCLVCDWRVVYRPGEPVVQTPSPLPPWDHGLTAEQRASQLQRWGAMP